MKKLVFYIISLTLLQSCDYFTIKNDDREVVARVRDTYLYKDEITLTLPQDYSQQDSIQITNNYISDWVKQQLLLSKAQINLSNDAKKFENLVKKYREDLYINAYKEAVISEYLNTDIGEEDIQQYYNNNKQNFKLNEELLKLKFIKIGKDVVNKNELIKLFKSSKKRDLDSLATKELSLKRFHLNDSIWIKYTDVLNAFPVVGQNSKTTWLKKGAFVQKEDSLSVYLLAVKDVLKRNDIAPKSYVEPTIKQMILHQRKLLLLRNIEETLVDDARKKRQFEIY